ncbi:hypothetical protein [Marinobacterium maritimum]|uniref:hypothetical protein n=1 Tax=Marinobacterium maritimum TaxID=500162 RepID=UPI0031D389D3
MINHRDHWQLVLFQPLPGLSLTIPVTKPNDKCFCLIRVGQAKTFTFIPFKEKLQHCHLVGSEAD